MTETCALLQIAVTPDETKPEMRDPNDAEVITSGSGMRSAAHEGVITMTPRILAFAGSTR